MTDTRFTGIKRRATRPMVRFVERATGTVITIGGIGTIVAVTLIMVFLVWVVVPLFTSARSETAGGFSPGQAGSAAPVHVSVDEYGLMSAAIGRDGSLRIHQLADGKLIWERRLFEQSPSATSFSVDGSTAAFGFEDGTLRLGELFFSAQFLGDAQVPESMRDLAPGQTRELEGDLFERTEQGRWRKHAFEARWNDPIELAPSDAIRAIDHVTWQGKSSICALTESGRLELLEAREKKNLMTRKVTYKLDRFSLPTQELEARGPPAELLLLGLGDGLVMIWEDGWLVRMDLRNAREAAVAQKLDVVLEEGERITCVQFMLGKSTLMIGDSLGRIRGWFTIKPEDAGTIDGSVLTMGHDLAGTSAVRALAASPRGRTLAASYQDGGLELFNVTADQNIGSVDAEVGAAHALAFFPKENGLIAFTPSRVALWSVDLRHPEASLASLFTPIWYEGYPEPEHVWQSTGGSDDFEPKLGLVPLIFGTIKATFYSILFGAPIALLAAIYTSEFLDRRLRAPVKSTIEMMASLPSVVLGFLGALVIAPFVQRVLPGTLSVFLTLPVTVMLGAYLWQLLPKQMTLRLQGWPRLACIFLALPLSVLLARWTGPLMERLLFAGDLEAWLDGQVGSALGGWFVLLIPASVLAVFVASNRFLGPWTRSRTHNLSHAGSARFDLFKFLLGAAAVTVLALVAAQALTAAALDPRGVVFGTYVQRNALIVGFVMGFAIVPIIYTLAEDALSSVPDHLRLASLGAGATPWQTAVRVVVPTAMSGMFSAVMIGLGRAVGETMIVLMATGNTAIMEWNVFNGFRTLSANLAVEVADAVEGSTHYRTLFLAALVLFAMTFVLNTFAEIVRQRFRKRAYEI